MKSIGIIANFGYPANKYLLKNCTNPLLVDTQKIVLVGSPLPKIHRLLLCPIGVLEVPFRDLPVLSDKRPELADTKYLVVQNQGAPQDCSIQIGIKL